MIEDPAEQALTALREHQHQMSMRFANPEAPVAAPRTGEFDRDEEF